MSLSTPILIACSPACASAHGTSALPRMIAITLPQTSALDILLILLMRAFLYRSEAIRPVVGHGSKPRNVPPKNHPRSSSRNKENRTRPLLHQLCEFGQAAIKHDGRLAVFDAGGLFSPHGSRRTKVAMLRGKREVVDTQGLVGQLHDDLVQMDAAPSDWIIVLLLARHLAAVAASAIFIVDHQPFAFHRSLSIHRRQSFPRERSPAHRGPGEMPRSRAHGPTR